MGRGFDLFMKNPYYRDMYDNAPTERLKAGFRAAWDNDIETLRSLPPPTREEVEYKARFAVGGYEKAVYKRWLKSFEENPEPHYITRKEAFGVD